MADRAEVLAATDDHLPFDDGEFDWVVLHLVSSGAPSARTAMTESCAWPLPGLPLPLNAARCLYAAPLTGRKNPWPGPAFAGGKYGAHSEARTQAASAAQQAIGRREPEPIVLACTLQQGFALVAHGRMGNHSH